MTQLVKQEMGYFSLKKCASVPHAELPFFPFSSDMHILASSLFPQIYSWFAFSSPLYSDVTFLRKAFQDHPI